MGSKEEDKTDTQYNIMSKDSHIGLAVLFDVPEGQDASPYKAKFYAKSKAGTKECLYYGFGTLGNKVICREGYKSTAGFLAHVNEVKDELEGLIKQVGKERVKILCSAPKADLENIKPHMDGRLTVKYLELDSGALMLNPLPSGCQDTHITILPEFTVPEGRMDEFKAGFEKFYNATKNGSGASGMYYYGFSVVGDSVYCREGYKNAEAALKHGLDIKELAQEPMKVVGAGGVKINVVGPAAELEKLKPKLAERGAVFWELDNQAFFM